MIKKGMLKVGDKVYNHNAHRCGWVADVSNNHGQVPYVTIRVELESGAMDKYAVSTHLLTRI